MGKNNLDKGFFGMKTFQFFGLDGFGEDNVKDLIGYLILLKIAMEDEATKHWQDLILEREKINPHQGYHQTTT